MSNSIRLQSLATADYANLRSVEARLQYAGDIDGTPRFDLDAKRTRIAFDPHGVFNPGRNIKYAKETPLANLHVAMMNQLGVPAEKFADSNGKLGYLADL